MSSTMQSQWSVVKQDDSSTNRLEMERVPVPTPCEYEVLVKIHAVALNFRDLMIVRGDYPFPLNLPISPCSDGAGEVVAIGDKVSRWKTGDRVLTLMNQTHLYGPSTRITAASGLGGTRAGTLREYGTFHEHGLVRAPRNLTPVEASTLVCAGVTAWNALYGVKSLQAGQSVLVLGTGGVSMFALQFAKAAGATVVATTSSEDKAALLKRYGANHVVNYKDDADWGETVRKVSPTGEGIDHIVEVGGVRTLSQSLKAIRPEGIISCIGSVSGAITDAEGVPTMIDCWLNNCIARGVSVGSRAQMEDMVASVEANDIHPLVDDARFGINDAKEAFEYYVSTCAGYGASPDANIQSQAQGKNFGKVVISLV